MLVLVVIGLVALIGFAGLSIDLASWYRQQRAEQATADAAALAGAQALPDDPATAAADALRYADANGAGVSASDIVISSDRYPNDTISVRVGKEAPAVFTKLFGISSVTVHAGAAARSDGVASAQYVAPVAVSSKHPMLGCKPPPCSGATQLDMVDLKAKGGPDAAGNFSLLDLRINTGGAVGDSTLADWLTNGYDAYMPLGVYEGVPGAKFNGSSFSAGARRPRRPGGALPRLQAADRAERLQRAVQHRRLGRLPDHRLLGRRQQRQDLRLVQALHRPGPAGKQARQPV